MRTTSPVSFRLLLSAAVLMLLSANIRADVIGHWSFDEYAGEGNQKFAESTGARNADGLKLDAIISSKPDITLVAGADIPFGKAVKFDGKKGGYLDLPYLGGMYKNSFSISVWVNADTAARYSVLSDWLAPNNSFFFGFDGAGTGLKPTVTLRNTTMTARKVGKPKAGAAPTANASMANTTNIISMVGATAVPTTFPLHSWHHIVWVWDRMDDARGTMTVYVDGVKAGSQDQLKTPLDIQNNTRGLKVGLKQDGEVSFSGELDELWIFNQALTADEVVNLKQYNALAKPAPQIASATTAPADATTQAAPAAVADGNGTPSTAPAVAATPGQPAAVSTTQSAIASTANTPAAPTPPAPSSQPPTTATPAAPAPTIIAQAPSAAPPAASSTPRTGINPLASASHVSSSTPASPTKLSATTTDTEDESDALPAVATIVPPRATRFTPLRSLGIVLSAASTLGLSAFLIWAAREKFRMRHMLHI